MNSKDRLVLQKMISYCEQIHRAHRFFRDDRGLFFDETEFGKMIPSAGAGSYSN